MPTLKQLEVSLGTTLDGVLGPEEFRRGSDGVWRRIRDSVLSCVQLQARSDGSAFCVNLGVHFDFVPIAAGSDLPDLSGLREPECELRSRLERDGQEIWWSDPDADGTDVAEVMVSSGLPFLNRYGDVRACLGAIPPGSVDEFYVQRLTQNLTRTRRLLLLARVNEHFGNPEWARAFAELGLSANPPTGPKVQLKRMLKRLG